MSDARRSSIQLARRFRTLALNLVLIVIAVLVLLPFYWLIVNSWLPTERAFSIPPNWIPQSFSIENFVKVFDLVPFGLMMFNSLKITFLVTLGAVVTSVLAGYAFARLRFPGRDALFVALLVALMVPQQMTVIPTFVAMRVLGLLDTHEAVILPGWISVIGIFLLRQAFMTFPRELEDAAKVDGAGPFRTLVQVVVPSARPQIAALAILTAVSSWNDFFWPNIFLASPTKMTLPVGLVSIQSGVVQSAASAPTVVVFAAIAMVIVPLIVILAIGLRAITEGMTRTGLQG